MTMKKTLKTVLLLMLVCIGFATNAHAQRNGGRLSLGVGLLYENGMDAGGGGGKPLCSYKHQ